MNDARDQINLLEELNNMDTHFTIAQMIGYGDKDDTPRKTLVSIADTLISIAYLAVCDLQTN